MKAIMQLHNGFILTQVKSGLILIDQQSAHERILFERFKTILANKNGASQQYLFPQNIELNPADFALVMELEEEFDINIPDDAAEKIQTVGQAIEYIEKAQS